MTSYNKLIVSNRSALTALYGSSGFEEVNAALNTLIATDQTKFIF
jgi:hypothetical protein